MRVICIGTGRTGSIESKASDASFANGESPNAPTACPTPTTPNTDADSLQLARTNIGNAITLLDKAIGAQGYYGAFTANMHTDFNPSAGKTGSDAIVASAMARGVPVITARQLLTWIDGRNGSSFQGLAWNGTALTFSVAVGTGANGLQSMVPTKVTAGTLATMTLNGSPVAFTRQIIKGVEYAIFTVAAGTYQATYAP